jgi:hypothetical protein
MATMGHDEEHPAGWCAQELAELRDQFPGFRIWREARGEHSRLVAVRRQQGASPHTVVTADPAELRAALSRARR